jgi:hypothetical protein
VLAALLMLWQGPGIFASRWLPATLALTHLLTLGFMAQVMLGALLQMLPVMVGVVIPRPRLIAALIHIPLTLGTLALVFAFLVQQPPGLQITFGRLGVAFGVALLAYPHRPVAGAGRQRHRHRHALGVAGVAGDGQFGVVIGGLLRLGLACLGGGDDRFARRLGLDRLGAIAGGGGGLSGGAHVPDHPAVSVVVRAGFCR